MTIRFYKQSFHLIEYDSTRISYNILQVKTYDCCIEEVALLCGHDGVSADHPDKAPLSCDQQTFVAIQNRLEYLSGLSQSLSDYQGFVSLFDGHPSSLFMDLYNGCNLHRSYCYAEGCEKKHDNKAYISGDDLIQRRPSDAAMLFRLGICHYLRQWRIAIEFSGSRHNCLSCAGKSTTKLVTHKQRVLSKSTLMKSNIPNGRLEVHALHAQYRPGFRL